VNPLISRPQVLALIGAALGMLLSALAHASLNNISCSVSATGVSFGTYNPVSPSALASTGSVTVSCSANGSGTDAATIALSTGSSGTYAARTMQSGTSTLSYNLYDNAAETMIWGNGNGASVIYNFTISIQGSGTYQTTATVYGLIPAGQNVAPGSYTDTITVTVSY
jgi:spore coat protein U-like protein